MNKKLYFGAVALAAITFASCSQEDSITADNDGGKVEKVNNTTMIGVSKLNGDAQSRTIVNVNSWELAWNDGNTQMFNPWNDANVGTGNKSKKTGFTVNVDRIAFLSAGGNWSYLTNPNNRQVFMFDHYTGAHDANENQANSNAIFKVSDYPFSTAKDYYDGLDPNTEYRGYYFLPFVKDKAMPVSGTGSESLVGTLQDNGFITDPINIYEWTQSGQTPEILQKYLAEYDFLTAKPHPKEGSTTTYSTILPRRDGTWNATTNSYNINIDMEHTMALVEIDVLLTANSATADTKGRNTRLTTCKIIAKQKDSNGIVNSYAAFDSYAALDADAAWIYPTPEEVEENLYQYDENGDLIKDENGNPILQTTAVQPGIMCYTTRTDMASTSWNGLDALSGDDLTFATQLFNEGRLLEKNSNGEIIDDGKTINSYKMLKFFMLVRNTKAPNFYHIELFSGTNYRVVKFNPGNNFYFEPGKYYRLVLKADVKNCDSGAWESEETTNVFRGIYPKNPASGEPIWTESYTHTHTTPTN